MISVTLGSNNSESALSNVQVTQFDESFSINDCLFLTLAESEKAWNEMYQAIGHEELNYLYENGEEMPYNEAASGSFKDKVITWIKNLWGKVAGMFTKMISWIKEKLNIDKKFVAKYKKDILVGASNIPADGLKIGKWYRFQNIKDTTMYSPTIADNVESGDIKISNLSQFHRELTAVKPGTRVSITGNKDICDKVVQELPRLADAIRGAILHGKEGEHISSKEFIQKIQHYFCGDSMETNITKADINANEIISNLEKSTMVINTTKEAYNKCKKVFDAKIKELNATNRTNYVKRASDNEIKELGNSIIKYENSIAKLIKELASSMATLSAQHIRALQMFSNQNRTIGRKLASLSGTAKTKEVKNESTDPFFGQLI